MGLSQERSKQSSFLCLGQSMLKGQCNNLVLFQAEGKVDESSSPQVSESLLYKSMLPCVLWQHVLPNLVASVLLSSMCFPNLAEYRVWLS
jgi:hypothetical protein